MTAQSQRILVQPLAKLADWTRHARWRHRCVAFGLGVLSILSMAPFFFWPVLWLTLPGLLWLMAEADQADWQPARRTLWRHVNAAKLGWLRAAASGWWFGFGYHVSGLFWVGEAFLVDANVFAWLLPFAVTLLPAGLALFTAVAAGFAVWAAPAGIQRVLALALGLGITEYLRGHIFSGFPWNILGYALTAPGALLQSAAWFGVYGLTILTVLVFALPSSLWLSQRRGLALALPAGVMLALFAAGWLQLYSGSFRYDTVGDLANEPRVRLVQPSIPQREKWLPENQRRIFDDHLALSLTAPDGTIDNAAGIALIVWPEAAMPFLPLQEPVALRDIGQMLPPSASLATGALRADPPTAPGLSRRVYNALLVFGHGDTARVLATYDKTHLVPFGEYLPLQPVLEAIGLQQLSRMRGGFASGIEPRALIDIPGIGRVAPLICYEAIFPGRVVQTRERPRALLNVTNDGWFGNTTGPRQHLHMARVRAVEEGLPLIRAANNGFSGVIGPYGRVYTQTSKTEDILALDVRGTIDAYLPSALPPPLYARLGDTIFALMAGVIAAALVWGPRRQNSGA